MRPLAPTLAAISAVMFAPFYPRVLATMPEKPEAASAPTLAAVAVCTLGPLIGVVALAASQAADLGSGARALLSHQSVAPTLADLPEWAPFRDKLAHAGPQIAEEAGETATAVAGFIGSSLTALTALTRRMVGFFLNIFAHLYALHIFLPLKVSAQRQVMAHTRLTLDMPAMLSARIVAISRAISRGTLLIGMVQRALGGLGFWAAGIDGAACWAVMITAASVILTPGGAFVVIGGAIYLAIEDNAATALVLGLWGGLWGGSNDNVLRPMLVVREAQMNDILIVIGTLGGLSAFDAAGLVLGPVLAGLFVAIWHAMAASASGDAPDALEANLEDMRRQRAGAPTEAP